MKKGLPRKRGVNSDVIMATAYSLLWRDFSRYTPLKDLAPGLPSSIVGSLEEFRKTSHVPINWDVLEAYPVKVMRQVLDFLKRYRFEKDAYTDSDLETITTEKFMSIQSRVAASTKPDSPFIQAVLGRARAIIRETLADFPSEETLLDLCGYGKKADQGCPSLEAYLDNKWRYPHTGSAAQIDFHQHAVHCNKQWQYADRYRIPFRNYTESNSLALVLVNKSWKILRPINPNTRIGAWLTSGIGKYMELRLKETLGLNLSKLQEEHKRLAQRASMSMRSATADLSAASDSIAPWLVRALLPTAWWHQLSTMRIPFYRVNGRKVRFGSFMGMGIGYTFPLQTLIFYALLKSIARLSRVRGVISVYGDDLVYPSRMHSLVYYVFTRLGFVFNEEKTYVSRHFRESCGGDYHRGIDVRPCSPEGRHQFLCGVRLNEFVFKLINGLKLRWEECEITSTLHYLRTIASQHGCGLLQVPMHFPDGSGEKVFHIRVPTWNEPFWARIGWNPNKQGFEFTYLSSRPRRRVVAVEYPYFWASLQRGTTRTLYEPIGLRTLPLNLQLKRIKELTGELRDFAIYHDEAVPCLTWSKKLAKSMEPSRSGVNVLDQTGSTSCWT